MRKEKKKIRSHRVTKGFTTRSADEMMIAPRRRYSEDGKAVEEESDPGTPGEGSGAMNVESGFRVEVEKDSGGSSGVTRGG